MAIPQFAPLLPLWSICAICEICGWYDALRLTPYASRTRESANRTLHPGFGSVFDSLISYPHICGICAICGRRETKPHCTSIAEAIADSNARAIAASIDYSNDESNAGSIAGSTGAPIGDAIAGPIVRPIAESNAGLTVDPTADSTVWPIAGWTVQGMGVGRESSMEDDP
jgi:hypothetical protein